MTSRRRRALMALIAAAICGTLFAPLMMDGGGGDARDAPMVSVSPSVSPVEVPSARSAEQLLADRAQAAARAPSRTVSAMPRAAAGASPRPSAEPAHRRAHCLHSVNSPDLVVDDRGAVCAAVERSGCCAQADAASPCATCGAVADAPWCCARYEYCVACCMEHARGLERRWTACRAVCRTNSDSAVGHEYTAQRFCFRVGVALQMWAVPPRREAFVIFEDSEALAAAEANATKRITFGKQ